MKTTLKILLTVTLLFTLAACWGGKDDLEDRIPDSQEEQDVKSYSGTIEAFELSIYQDGTHQVKTDTETIVIQSPTINLNNYLGKNVVVEGSMQKLIDNKSEVFTVDKVKLEGADDIGGETEYENKKFGFSFTYPSLWALLEDSNGLTLRSNGVNWVTIDIFNTDAELDDFIASKEIEDGTSVTIGGQRSLRYTESEEIRIYTPNVSKGKIYKITFNNEEDDKEQKELFYELLESFTLFVSKTKQGEKCGGEDDLTCEEDYRCELESGEEDADGICIPVDETGMDLDCPYVPIPSGCSEYEPKNVNKDGCTTSYECLDPEEEEEDSDITASRTDKALAADGDESRPKPAIPKKSEVDAVVSTFMKHKDKILSAEAEVVQFEIMEEQDLLAVVYKLEEEIFRSQFTYTPSADEFNFLKKAYWEEGEERDWVLMDGEPLEVTSDKKIIKPGSGTSGIQVVYEDMRLYENSYKDFSAQYPKNWYYRSFGSIENTVWSVGFGDKPLDHISDAIISLVILDEASFGKKEQKDDRYLVEVSRDEDSHFLLDGPLEMKDTIDKMAETIVQN